MIKHMKQRNLKKSASRGGKNMFSKRNNTKRKTCRAKNGNNKSKNGASNDK